MELSLATLSAVMRFRPTLGDIAALFEVSEDTVQRRIKEWTGLKYSEFKEKHSLGIKHRLMDKAIEMALAGDRTMLIFTLKNYCGWSDKPVEEDKPQRTFTLNYARNKREPEQQIIPLHPSQEQEFLDLDPPSHVIPLYLDEDDMKL